MTLDTGIGHIGIPILSSIVSSSCSVFNTDCVAYLYHMLSVDCLDIRAYSNYIVRIDYVIQNPRCNPRLATVP